MAISAAAREKVYGRSYGRCEAYEELVMPSGRAVLTRCPYKATEVHHALTRARGGDILDAVHETYHLIHLCNSCHALSQGYKEDYEHGMVIQGFVLWNTSGEWPLYRGSNEYLTKMYGPNVEHDVPRKDDQGDKES